MIDELIADGSLSVDPEPPAKTPKTVAELLLGDVIHAVVDGGICRLVIDLHDNRSAAVIILNDHGFDAVKNRVGRIISTLAPHIDAAIAEAKAEEVNACIELLQGNCIEMMQFDIDSVKAKLSARLSQPGAKTRE